jgi:hypothetical protein
VLQIHYTNKRGLEGQFDASGVRLTTTLALRPRDVWVVMLGTMVIINKPGLAAVSTIPSECGAACSGRMRKPLRILKASLHMHGVRRAARAGAAGRGLAAGLFLPARTPTHAHPRSHAHTLNARATVLLPLLQTGTSMSLRHFRNGTELQPLAIRSSYDYGFQIFVDGGWVHVGGFTPSS